MAGRSEGRTDHLRLEVDTGTHASTIEDVLVAVGGSFFCTVGGDNRIKRWDRIGGSARLTMLGHAGPGRDGDILTTALHPDGSVLVVAARRESTSDGRPSCLVWAFDTESGRIRRTFRCSSMVRAMAFDPTGRHLITADRDQLAVLPAASFLTDGAPAVEPLPTNSIAAEPMAAPSAIAAVAQDEATTRIFVASLSSVRPQIFDLADGALVERRRAPTPGRDRLPRGPVVPRPDRIAAGPRGVAVAGRQGDLVLFDLDGGGGRSVPGAGGGAPAGLAFSPDGSRLVVGSRAGRRSEVTVHDLDAELAIIGRRRYDADAAAVGFLDDHTVIAAGGSRLSVHRWSATTNRGGPDDVVVDGAGQAIDAVGIESVERGRTVVAFGHPDPADPDHIEHGPPGDGPETATLCRRFDLASLELLPNAVAGALIDFGGFRRAVHQMDGRRLAIGAADGNLVLEPEGHPLTGHGRLATTKPTAFGFLDDGRVAVAEESGVVRLLRVADDGSLTARTLLPADVPTLDLATDGRWLVTGGRDQLLRLWYLPDLEEGPGDPDDSRASPALSLFVTAVNEWAIWSPSGFYAASPLGDRHLIFTLNREDGEAALTFSSDRFFDHRYRPALIKRILEEGDEERALAALNIVPTELESVLPPVVELSSIEEGESEAILRFRVLDIGGPPTTRVSIVHDGIPYCEATPLPGQVDRYEERVWLRSGPNRFSIQATNDEAKAMPVEVPIDWPPVTVVDEVIEDDDARGAKIIIAPDDDRETEDDGSPGARPLPDLGPVDVAPDVAPEDVAPDVDSAPAPDLAPDMDVAPDVDSAPDVDVVPEPDVDSAPAPDLAPDMDVVRGPVRDLEVDDDAEPEPEPDLLPDATPSADGDGGQPTGEAALTSASLVLGLDAESRGELTVAAARNGIELWRGTATEGSALRLSLDLPLVDGVNDLRLTATDPQRTRELLTARVVLGPGPSNTDSGDEPEVARHRVARGETLRSIARTHYGDAAHYMLIFEANRDVLDNPDRVYPGQDLRIPVVDGQRAVADQERPADRRRVAEPPPPAPTVVPLTMDDEDVPPPLPDQEGGPVGRGGDPAETTAATGGNGATQEPSGPATPRSRPTEAQPKLFLLTIGVSDLARDGGALVDLQYASDDALEVASRFSTGRSLAFDGVWRRVITDGLATGAGIRSALAELKQAVDERTAQKRRDNVVARDVALFFFAGHGITRRGEGAARDTFYLIPHDFDEGRVEETAVTIDEVGRTLSALPTEVIILLDACRSGAALSGVYERSNPAEMAKQLQAIRDRTLYIVSATSNDETAWEHPMLVPYQSTGRPRARVGHGFFTHAILKKMDESGDSLSLMELLAAVQRQLVIWTDRDGWRHVTQRPKARIDGEIPHMEIYKRKAMT